MELHFACLFFVPNPNNLNFHVVYLLLSQFCCLDAVELARLYASATVSSLTGRGLVTSPTFHSSSSPGLAGCADTSNTLLGATKAARLQHLTNSCINLIYRCRRRTKLALVSGTMSTFPASNVISMLSEAIHNKKSAH